VGEVGVVFVDESDYFLVGGWFLVEVVFEAFFKEDVQLDGC
jgi:hypothetical protein